MPRPPPPHPTCVPTCGTGSPAASYGFAGTEQSLKPPRSPHTAGLPPQPPSHLRADGRHAQHCCRTTGNTCSNPPLHAPISPSPSAGGMRGSGGTPGPAIGTGCAPPPLRGSLQAEDASHSRHPHLAGPGRLRCSPCRDPTSPTLDGTPQHRSERAHLPAAPSKTTLKSTAGLPQPMEAKLCPTPTPPPPPPSSSTFTCRTQRDMAQRGCTCPPPQQEGSPAVSAPTQHCFASCPHSTAARRGAQRPSQIGRWDGMGGGLTRGGQVAAVSAATHSRRDGQRVTVGSTAPWAPHGHPMGTPIPTAPSSWGAAALSHSGSSSGVTAG